MTLAPGSIVVTATGVASPLGLSAPHACAAIRAGLCRFREHASFVVQPPDPPVGEPERAVVSALPRHLLPATDPAERLLALATLPFAEVLPSAGFTRASLEEVALLACVPSPERRPVALDPGVFPARLLERLGIGGELRLAAARGGGSTGVLSALAEAADLLTRRACRACLVLGVDSWVDVATLEALDATGRLRSERGVDGFIPGECAALLLVETTAGAARRGARPLAQLLGVGAGTERQPFTSPHRSTGRGLGDALARALGQAAGEFFTICDLNGESYRGDEWGLALALLGQALAPQRALWHPADALGDTGAAFGALAVALAAHAFGRPRPPAGRALLWAGDDGGERAACLLGAA